MRLVKLRVVNFKRFVGAHALDLDEQLVALVGPNEAGKSSLLAALDRLGSGQSPHADDRTRLSSDRCTIEGHYALDEADHEATRPIHDADRVSVAIVSRHLGDETSYWALTQSPVRDLAPRRRCRDVVKALIGDPALDPSNSTDEALIWDQNVFDTVLGALESEDETLSGAEIDSFDDLARRLRAIEYEPFTESEQERTNHEATEVEARASARMAAADLLEQQLTNERQPPPAEQVIEVLDRRLPSTALFRPEDRVLESHYDLNAVADGNAPSALANLAAVAGFDLTHIRDLVAAGQRPHVQTLLDEANRRLKERFLASWRQARIFPHFTLDQTLQVYVSTEESDFSYPAERSDGLRWFLALYAFLLSRQAKDLILLVDEAETHLHYDAQADLIDALMSQSIASKVIYTTHSIGCLPPDLGRGIRAVVPEEGAERSSIKNTYWWLAPGEDEKVGHIPLLFGMGSSLLALTVPRFAVITEGPSDAILLPSLIRRAITTAPLPYRVVPGLSEIKNEYIPRLRSHAGEIVCLVDGDKGGRTLARNLAQHGIPGEQILSLSVFGEDVACEDLVNPEVFARAVNDEVASWGGSPLLTVSDIPERGRWVWLRRAHPGVERSLNKNRVAGRMVDLINTADQIDAVLPHRFGATIRDLDQSIRTLLGCVPPEDDGV